MPSQSPTARWIFQCFQGIPILYITQNNIHKILVINLKERQQVILNAIGKTFRQIYTIRVRNVGCRLSRDDAIC